jgi:signal peptidase I
MLEMFIHDGHIPKDTYFILGDNVNNSKDSRLFGAVSSADFLGKFELLK